MGLGGPLPHLPLALPWNPRVQVPLPGVQAEFSHQGPGHHDLSGPLQGNHTKHWRCQGEAWSLLICRLESWFEVRAGLWLNELAELSQALQFCCWQAELQCAIANRDFIPKRTSFL